MLQEAEAGLASSDEFKQALQMLTDVPLAEGAAGDRKDGGAAGGST